MMMTQKKLLVSGIRWQVGKRRKGKPSSSVFGQTLFYFSLYGYMSSAKMVYQAFSSGFFSELLIIKLGSLPGKQLPVFCFASYTLSLAHCGTMRPAFLSETADLKAVVGWSCSFTERCSVGAAFPLLQPVSLRKLTECIWGQIGLSEEREEKVKRSN